MLFSAVALLLATRMLGRREYGWQLAVATGVALGLGQLVRAFSLWTFAAVVLAFAVARAWRPLAVIVLAAAVVTAPWYVRQAVKYGNPVFDRPTKNQAIWERRPARFYVGLGLPDVVDRSDPAALPATRRFRRRTARSGATTSASGAAAASGRASSACCRRCSRSRAGSCLLVALAAGARAAAGRAAAGPRAPRLPLLHGQLSRRRTGTCLKASYMLTTAPAWALAFGYAVDRLPGRCACRRGRDPGRLGARKPAVPAVLTAVTAVLFTCAGQRVDIVGAFKPRRRHGRSPRTPTRSRRRSTRPTRMPSSRGSTTRATSRLCGRSSRSTTCG